MGCMGFGGFNWIGSGDRGFWTGFLVLDGFCV